MSRRNRRSRRVPNYQADLLQLACRHAVPGRFVHLVTLHDGWCDQLAGRGPCNCNPEVREAGDLRREAILRN